MAGLSALRSITRSAASSSRAPITASTSSVGSALPSSFVDTVVVLTRGAELREVYQRQVDELKDAFEHQQQEAEEREQRLRREAEEREHRLRVEAEDREHRLRAEAEERERRLRLEFQAQLQMIMAHIPGLQHRDSMPSTSDVPNTDFV